MENSQKAGRLTGKGLRQYKMSSKRPPFSEGQLDFQGSGFGKPAIGTQ